ncbi:MULTISPECIES: hypothetical protein [unclassified Spirillospora]|uniref:hypothetical protein n=1 Tax=unclassified Spirillospora TaxID=2642701 RepID=UPI00371AB1D5
MSNGSRTAIAILSMAGAIGLFILAMVSVTADSNRQNAIQVAILGGFGVLALANFAGSLLSGAAPSQPLPYRPQPLPPGAPGYAPYAGQPQPGYQPQPGQAHPGQQ